MTRGVPGFATGGETERLPRFDAGSGLAITASARLDGRAGLCDSLGIPRLRQAGFSDRSLILKAYERWGRWIMRRAFDSLLPPEVRWTPCASWTSDRISGNRKQIRISCQLSKKNS